MKTWRRLQCWLTGHRWVYESVFSFGNKPAKHSAECKRCGKRVTL